MLLGTVVALAAPGCERSTLVWRGAEFREVRSMGQLPTAVQRRLHIGRDVGTGIADPGQPFNPSDLIADPRLPSSRLAVAGRAGESWVVAIERGGLAYRVEVLLFETAELPALRFATISEPPTSYRGLLRWLPK